MYGRDRRLSRFWAHSPRRCTRFSQPVYTFSRRLMSNVPAKIFRKSQPLCRMLHVLRETMRRDKNGKGASLIHAQTRPNAGSVVMQHSYSFGLRLPFYDGSDPNGIRTHFEGFVTLRDSVINIRQAAC